MSPKTVFQKRCSKTVFQKQFSKNSFPTTVFPKTVFQKQFSKNGFPKTVFQKRFSKDWFFNNWFPKNWFPKNWFSNNWFPKNWFPISCSCESLRYWSLLHVLISMSFLHNLLKKSGSIPARTLNSTTHKKKDSEMMSASHHGCLDLELLSELFLFSASLRPQTWLVFSVSYFSQIVLPAMAPSPSMFSSGVPGSEACFRGSGSGFEACF